MVTIAALVAVPLLLEAAFRIAHDIPLFSKANFLVQSVDLLSVHALNRYDETLGWVLRDGLRAFNGDMTTGRYGIRMNDSQAREPPQGGILAVGDSYTAGSLVKDTETWPSVLEKLVGVPVLNASAGGWGVDQIVLNAERLIPILRPRAVVVGIFIEDIIRSAFEMFGGGFKPWFAVENNQAVLRGVPVPRPDAKSFSLNKWQSIFGRSFLVHWAMRRWGGARWQIDPAQKYRRVHADPQSAMVSCCLLDRVARFAAQHGARVGVIIFWTPNDALKSPEQPLAALVAEFSRKRGLPTIDLYHLLRSVAVRDAAAYRRLWLEDGHMSAEGNAWVAQVIREAFFNEKAA
jgi:hypothetical protein